MTTFVLVGGFWIGAWAWRDVALRLAEAGHRAVALDLTGLGARQGEAGPDTGLDTHIGDVIAAIQRDDLRDVVLVGHSGAGAIVNGVADRIPERVAGIIFVDTGPVPDGQAIADFSGPEGVPRRRSARSTAGACRCRHGRNSAKRTLPALTRRSVHSSVPTPQMNRSVSPSTRSH